MAMPYSTWSRYDESGVRQTCPLIDEIISLLEGSENECDIIALCEKVRGMNEDLRRWGSTVNYELTEEVDDLKHTIKELERKIETTE
jgi:hypothetical protein